MPNKHTKPPYSERHPVTTNVFLTEFPDSQIETAFIVIFKPAHYAMTNTLTLLTTCMRMRVNTLPPYQYCLIDTRHSKHAEELPDLSYPGTMKLSTMLSESVRKQNANGERQRLPMIWLISSQRETMWPIWWIRLGGTSTLSLWLKTVLIKGSWLMLRKSFWAWRMNPCLSNTLTRP